MPGLRFGGSFRLIAAIWQEPSALALVSRAAAKDLLGGSYLERGAAGKSIRAPRREGRHLARCALRDRTADRQAGPISAAPTRKHTAPMSVPALSNRRSSTVPLLGTTKPAIADTMKATEPSMLSHAIHQGKSRNRGRQDPAPRAEIANALETRNRTEPKTSGRQTCLSASEALRLCASAANVLWLKKSVPGNCVAAAIQFLSRGH